MNDDDGAGTRAYATLELRWFDVVRIGVNVRENGLGSERAHGTSGRNERERRQDNLVA
jgi:hypothetical protein